MKEQGLCMVFLDFVQVLVVMKKDQFHLCKMLQCHQKDDHTSGFLVASHQPLVSVVLGETAYV